MPNHDMPQLIPPMLAKSGRLPHDCSAYGFEIKWDGIRVVSYMDKGTLRLLSRNLKDITRQYPELASLVDKYPHSKLVLDGEIVALDSEGRPSFSLLQHRMGLSSPASIRKMLHTIPATYIIFDILYLDGRLLLDLPYVERRQILSELSPSGPGWQTPAFRPGDGPDILAASKSMNLEGILAKRLDSPYQSGQRTGAWLKIKNQRRQELVIAGWVPGQGKRQGSLGALLVGYYNLIPEAARRCGAVQELLYAGKVGTGFSDKTLTELAKLLTPLHREKNPFNVMPPVKDAIFTEPLLIGEFEFTEWTPANTLRHPSFKGLRTDKDPKTVIREQI